MARSMLLEENRVNVGELYVKLYQTIRSISDDEEVGDIKNKRAGCVRTKVDSLVAIFCEFMSS